MEKGHVCHINYYINGHVNQYDKLLDFRLLFFYRNKKYILVKGKIEEQNRTSGQKKGYGF